MTSFLLLTDVSKSLTLQELDDIINDVIIVPPEPDPLTDDNEANNDILGLAEVNDVPGELTMHYKSLITSENPEIHKFEDVNEAGPSNAQDKSIAVHKRKQKDDIYLMTHFNGEKHHQFTQKLLLKDQ